MPGYAPEFSAYLDVLEQFSFLMLRAISVVFELLNAQMPLSMIVLTFAESMLSAYYTYKSIFSNNVKQISVWNERIVHLGLCVSYIKLIKSLCEHLV